MPTMSYRQLVCIAWTVWMVWMALNMPPRFLHGFARRPYRGSVPSSSSLKSGRVSEGPPLSLEA